MASEVKKADNNTLLPQSSFIPLSPNAQNSTTVSLGDYGALYSIFGNDSFSQGLNLDDFIGEQIRAKYLYIGLHLQQINSAGLYTTGEVEPLQGGVSNTMYPVTIRCMLIQDRNYNNFQSPQNPDNGSSITSLQSMVYNIFGIDVDTSYSATEGYINSADFTLLPINPHEPGRFNVIRDFKMNTAPGWRADYYKKLMILQRDLNSKGRIYFANSPVSDAGEYPPGQNPSVRYVSRNNLYLLFLWQMPFLINAGASTVSRPVFNLSVQTRFAYYDN